MMLKSLAAVSCLTLLVGGVAWKFGAFDSLFDETHGALAACEEYLVETLRAPSSYKLVWHEYKPAPPLTFSEFRRIKYGHLADCDGVRCSEAADWLDASVEAIHKEIDRKVRTRSPLDETEKAILSNRERMDADAAANLPSARTAFVTVEYDAENAFGAPLRSFAMCRFSGIGEDGRFDRLDILSAGPIDDAGGRLVKKMAAPSE